jgi:hypothetical protein
MMLFNNSSEKSHHNFEAGISLPITLFLVLAIMAASSIFAAVGVQNIREMKLAQSTSDSFYVAEGALQDFIGQLGVYSQLWREKVNLENLPLNYTRFNPLTYTLNNGVPSCQGHACQRQVYPVGGGLLKNFGPLSGDGQIVNVDAPITAQLNQESPQLPDIVLNNRGAWYQVERLDESSLSENSIGAGLTNYEAHNGGYSAVRFRVTAVSNRRLKGKLGLSTVVAVLELPPT